MSSHTAGSSPATPYPGSGFDYLSMSNPETLLPQGGWGSVHLSSHMAPSPPDTAPRFSKFSLPLVTDGLSGLSSSVDSVSDVEYLSPLSQSYTREEMPFGGGGGGHTVLYDGYASNQQNSPMSQSPRSALVLDHGQVPTSCPGLVYAPSEPSSSLASSGLGPPSLGPSTLTSHLDPFDAHLGHKLMRDCDPLSEHYAATCPVFPF